MEGVEKKSKASYEDLKKENDNLKNYCSQLLEQRNQVAQQLNSVQSIINKLPWLFKVLAFKEAFSAEFVESAVKEIEAIMTPPREEETEKSEGEG